MQTENYQDFLLCLGRSIQKRRKQLGMSQERLAAVLNMDRVSIGYIEQGRRSPKLSTLYSIAEALDVNIIDLLK